MKLFLAVLVTIFGSAIFLAGVICIIDLFEMFLKGD